MGPKPEPEQDETGNDSSQTTFSYERLKAKSENPVTGIDLKRREVCAQVLFTFLHSDESQFLFLIFIDGFSGLSF